MNKSEKERIINCIIADIPTTDHIAQGRSDFATEVERTMPAAVLKIWKNPELSDWINLGSYWPTVRIPGIAMTAHAPQARNVCNDAEFLNPYVEKQKEQRDKIESVRKELQNAFANVKSEKQFRDQFPEFVKYLPEKSDSSNLPAKANLITNLKLMGYPKK